MSLLRSKACKALADAIGARIALPAPPAIMQAPPSGRSVYPAVTIMIERSRLQITPDEYLEVNPELDLGDVGKELTGVFRTDENGNYAEGDIYVDPATGATLSSVGTMRCTGRIWCAGRSAAAREQLEDDIVLVFMQDEASPTRIMLDVGNITVGGVKVPFGWACADIDSTEWTSEMAFGERMWSYLSFNLDAPIIVPRFTPLATTLILAMTSDLATPVTDVEDLDELEDLVEVSVDRSGNASTVP